MGWLAAIFIVAILTGEQSRPPWNRPQGGVAVIRHWEPVGHREYQVRRPFTFERVKWRVVVTPEWVARCGADWIHVWGPGWRGVLDQPYKIEKGRAWWLVHRMRKQGGSRSAGRR